MAYRNFTSFVLAPLVLAAPVMAAPVATPQFQAGAAKVSITPTPGTFPFPYNSTLSCEPESIPGKPCNFTGVHDDVYARALMVGDGARSAVIVLVEATAVPDPAALKADVARVAGVPEANVLLAATHTHEVLLVGYHGGAANPAQQREIDRLKAGVIEAVRTARAGLRPARIGFGRGKGWVNVNNGDSVGTAGYNPDGPSDKSLDVIKVDGLDGKPIALLVNYASHAEVMYRSVTKDGGYEVTGDIPGAVSGTLERVPTMAPVVLFSAAAEGDQLPLFKSAQHEDGPLPFKDSGTSGWALLDEMARRLSRSVLDIVAAMPAGAARARVDAAATSATCPGQHRHLDARTGQFVSDPAPSVAIPLNVVRIDDIALAGVGGDVGSEIGMAVKQASPAPHTTLVTVTAGSVGYVLADASYARDSHGVTGSPLAPHCAEPAIVSGLNGLIASLWPKP